ncbi:hypothetical protein Leryth_014745 [Lithospermum erythrorhizon]|nr:hypothetical protein Leryth_014745 [Lithospermum erythrorhizon]
MRPSTLEDIVGQDHLLSSDTLIKSAIERGRLPSIILWGPPGCGKTTIAKAIVNSTKARCSYRFVSLSAVTCGVKDVRDVSDEARKWRNKDSAVNKIGNSSKGKGTILFIDEVHRFNKGQQDSLLPVIEDGSVVFVGATTENPSFHLNTPLLSRCRVLTLNPLKPEHIAVLLRRAVSDVQKGLLCSISSEEVAGVEANDDAISFLSENTDGDVRVALNALEISATTAAARLRSLVGSRNGVEGNGDVELPEGNGDVELPSAPTCVITLSDVKEALQCKHIAYDRDGEEHYNQISALHKSMRGSDPDAAIYWLARMLEGGEKPLYIARRLIRFASEDVGLADPSALVRAVECYQACHSLGMPACDVILTQCVSYLSLAPKSIAVYKALQAAQKVVRESVGQNERMPLQGYIRPPENPDIAETRSFLPPSLQGYKFLDWPPVEGDGETRHSQ